MSTSLKPDEVLKRAHAIGTYYGFTPLSRLALKVRAKKNEAMPESINFDSLDQEAKETALFLKHVRDAGITPSKEQPLFVWHTNIAPGRATPKTVTIQFHAIGVDHAIADVVLIRAVRSLMKDLSKHEPILRINSMGDKETRGRFARELSNFFRKHGPVLPADCVSCAKKDVFEAAELLVNDDAQGGMLPSPTDHLSEASRKHFESVLEYLESTDTPYELTPNLLSRGASWTETCFDIRSDERTGAWGARYADMTKAFFKSTLPSVGAIVRITLEDRAPAVAIKERPGPRFVFVHIGDEAKRESMKMADDLRRARIPLAQALGIQSLTQQLHFAETLNPQYLIIMGRKEALERTVILRERANHTETFIPLDSLIDRLKLVA